MALNTSEETLRAACVELINYHRYCTSNKVTGLTGLDAEIYIVTDPEWRAKLTKMFTFCLPPEVI